MVAQGAPVEPCRIEVVAKGSGWPVPLAELRTTHQVRFVTDNAGLIAFDLPELMGRETWFHVIGHGYGVPPDGFGQRGVRLVPTPGGKLRIEVERTNIARRIGRLTGSGLFAESEKLGLSQGDADGVVLGCDSVQTAVIGGRLFWLWGDTTLAHHPLGIFHSTGATTSLRPLTSLEPPLRLNYDYFLDAARRPRPLAPLRGDGPTWLTGLVTLLDKSGAERIVAFYRKIKPPLEAYEWGLAAWNAETAQFQLLKKLWSRTEGGGADEPLLHDGHPAFWTDDAGKRWLLLGNPLPVMRCPATFEAWQDRSTWEMLTPQKHLAAAHTGAQVEPHSGSIAWHPWRKRWVTVFMEKLGKPSDFGEIWYAEADAPTGPWGPAVKILTHENYTFYNPRLHVEFTPEGTAHLFFEGTYTAEFARHAPKTPRYDYNQVLYRLDLDDPALASARGEE
jgi:hypothetical protein